MRKEITKNIYFNFSIDFWIWIYYVWIIFQKHMAKKRKVGRPEGAKKEPMNIFIRKDRAASLRNLAITEQKTISIMVENALERTYGI